MLRFDEPSHTYWLGERRLPSVSEIIAPAVDLSGIPEAVLERKSAIGKATHLACQIIDEGDQIEGDLDPSVAGYVDAWRRFVAENEPEFDLIEAQLYSEAKGYAGTPDRRATMRGQRWMLDIKTVSKVSKSTGLQTAGYCGLLPDGLTLKRAAVQLLPDGKYSFHQFDDPLDHAAFLSLLTFHNWRTKNGC